MDKRDWNHHLNSSCVSWVLGVDPFVEGDLFLPQIGEFVYFSSRAYKRFADEVLKGQFVTPVPAYPSDADLILCRVEDVCFVEKPLISDKGALLEAPITAEIALRRCSTSVSAEMQDTSLFTVILRQVIVYDDDSGSKLGSYVRPTVDFLLPQCRVDRILEVQKSNGQCLDCGSTVGALFVEETSSESGGPPLSISKATICEVKEDSFEKYIVSFDDDEERMGMSCWDVLPGGVGIDNVEWEIEREFSMQEHQKIFLEAFPTSSDKKILSKLLPKFIPLSSIFYFITPHLISQRLEKGFYRTHLALRKDVERLRQNADIMIPILSRQESQAKKKSLWISLRESCDKFFELQKAREESDTKKTDEKKEKEEKDEKDEKQVKAEQDFQTPCVVKVRQSRIKLTLKRDRSSTPGEDEGQNTPIPSEAGPSSSKRPKKSTISSSATASRKQPVERQASASVSSSGAKGPLARTKSMSESRPMRTGRKTSREPRTEVKHPVAGRKKPTDGRSEFDGISVNLDRRFEQAGADKRYHENISTPVNPTPTATPSASHLRRKFSFVLTDDGGSMSGAGGVGVGASVGANVGGGGGGGGMNTQGHDDVSRVLELDDATTPSRVPSTSSSYQVDRRLTSPRKPSLRRVASVIPRKVDFSKLANKFTDPAFFMGDMKTSVFQCVQYDGAENDTLKSDKGLGGSRRRRATSGRSKGEGSIDSSSMDSRLQSLPSIDEPLSSTTTASPRVSELDLGDIIQHIKAQKGKSTDDSIVKPSSTFLDLMMDVECTKSRSAQDGEEREEGATIAFADATAWANRVAAMERESKGKKLKEARSSHEFRGYKREITARFYVTEFSVVNDSILFSSEEVEEVTDAEKTNDDETPASTEASVGEPVVVIEDDEYENDEPDQESHAHAHATSIAWKSCLLPPLRSFYVGKPLWHHSIAFPAPMKEFVLRLSLRESQSSPLLCVDEPLQSAASWAASVCLLLPDEVVDENDDVSLLTSNSPFGQEVPRILDTYTPFLDHGVPISNGRAIVSLHQMKRRHCCDGGGEDFVCIDILTTASRDQIQVSSV
eukprot:TRINITY_DN2167_c0_g2_i1.p1 TRINITY_DN2167_c0_g2~~TRINITY_DN2167_c0_g2_i1.p1  ORF type:complete len:1062 (-),score=286.42 TRINITY_DN2167_c0_g2_i1:106-3291(-)